MAPDHPTFITKVKSGNVFLGDTQFLPGYCVLFADPAVPSLNDLSLDKRAEFLSDMSVIGDAIISLVKPIRINYAILCNSHPFLHVHVFPRYEWEANDLKTKNVWQYPEHYWWGSEYKFDPDKHSEIKCELQQLISPPPAAYGGTPGASPGQALPPQGGGI